MTGKITGENFFLEKDIQGKPYFLYMPIPKNKLIPITRFFLEKEGYMLIDKEYIYHVTKINACNKKFEPKIINKSTEKIDINFRNLKIKDLARMVGRITDINISLEEDFSQKINFVSNKPIEKGYLIPLTKTILESKGITLNETKNGYKVVKIKKEKEANVRTVLFQVSDKKDELTSLLEKCKKYEYISNEDDGFYLIVTASNDILISLKKIILQPK